MSGIDLVTDRNNIRKLLRFVSTSANDQFEIQVEIVGEKTTLFTRVSPQRIMNARGTSGFGHSFEKAVTKDQLGTGHHRIISYQFGGMKMIVRFETDAYLDEKHGNFGEVAFMLPTGFGAETNSFSSARPEETNFTATQTARREGFNIGAFDATIGSQSTSHYRNNVPWRYNPHGPYGTGCFSAGVKDDNTNSQGASLTHSYTIGERHGSEDFRPYSYIDDSRRHSVATSVGPYDNSPVYTPSYTSSPFIPCLSSFEEEAQRRGGTPAVGKQPITDPTTMPRPLSKPPNTQTWGSLSSQLNSLSLTPPDIENTPYKPPSQQGLQVQSLGHPIPASQILEIKTRSATSKSRDERDALPQLWISQTPHLLIGYHHSGGWFDRIDLKDMRSEITEWETVNQENLGKLVGLLKWIFEKVKEVEGRRGTVRFEGGDMIRVLAPDVVEESTKGLAGRSPQQKNTQRRALPDDLYERWSVANDNGHADGRGVKLA
jgi:hypothetical protein